VDDRKLYLPAGHPSMYLYCIRELHLSEDSALRRITAARATRRFPAILDAIARGHLHLTAVSRLASHLTEGNAAELIGAASHRSTQEIEKLLAERFPQTDLLTWAATSPSTELVSGRVDEAQVVGNSISDPQQLVPGRVESRARMTPLSSQSVALQATLSRATHEKLRYAQELLGHKIPSGDLAQMLDRVLDLAIAQLEKQKFGATPRPRRGGRERSANPRYIPLHVRRAVWERDGGQCTFVGENGHRCEARKRLEFDHVREVARGGEATAEGIQLRCRAHNQHTAERTFGGEFMRHKRISAAEMRAAVRAARAKQSARTPEPVDDPDHSVVPWLRALGFSAAEARCAAERCEHMPDAPLEERVRVALSTLRVRGARFVPAPSEAGLSAVAG
jgi:hypothetical protein